MIEPPESDRSHEFQFGGRALTVAQVQRAARDRSAWYERILGLFGEYDFLALPAAQVFPFPAEWPWPRRIADRAMDSYHRWMEVAVPGTLSGCPVVSLPAGFGPGGLPMGVQVIGRPAGLFHAGTAAGAAAGG